MKKKINDSQNIDVEPKSENGLRISFRLYDQSEILRFKAWQRELKGDNKSVSVAIGEVVMNYLKDIDKRVMMRELKDDMFYAFRKALYASMYPFTNSIKNKIDKYEIETSLAGKKIDMILNVLSNPEIEFNPDVVNEPDEKILNESLYFKQIRNIFNSELEKLISNQKQKARELAKTTKKYTNYEFNNELDSNIENDMEE
ncbi:hypothetical protein KQ878_00820 [Mycoplasma zalophidermidis]|uniref:ICEF Integrative Conjugal Element-II n=1 Tax=Mycoplasma zalophidermidis TaxID=398174 RepID=A0ABS6DR00_9MOLU|nr:hypothetical protein [Mycoplasma zalophidermidis]MBU4693428.1 hypothetical protein [Mycoplasma zalophidermidis]